MLYSLSSDTKSLRRHSYTPHSVVHLGNRRTSVTSFSESVRRAWGAKPNLNKHARRQPCASWTLGQFNSIRWLESERTKHVLLNNVKALGIHLLMGILMTMATALGLGTFNFRVTPLTIFISFILCLLMGVAYIWFAKLWMRKQRSVWRNLVSVISVLVLGLIISFFVVPPPPMDFNPLTLYYMDISMLISQFEFMRHQPSNTVLWLGYVLASIIPTVLLFVGVQWKSKEQS